MGLFLEKAKHKLPNTQACINCGCCTRQCHFLSKHKLNLAQYLAADPSLAYQCSVCDNCKRACPVDISGYEIGLYQRSLEQRRPLYAWYKQHYPLEKLERYSFRSTQAKFKTKSQSKSGNKATKLIYFGCNAVLMYPKTCIKLLELTQGHTMAISASCCQKPVLELGWKTGLDAKLRAYYLQGIREIYCLCANCYKSMLASLEHDKELKLKLKIFPIYKLLKELNFLHLQQGVHLDDQLDDQIDDQSNDKAYPVYVSCPDRDDLSFFKAAQDLLPGAYPALNALACCGLGGQVNHFSREHISNCNSLFIKELEKLDKKNHQEQHIDMRTKQLYTYCASCASRFNSALKSSNTRLENWEVLYLLSAALGVKETAQELSAPAAMILFRDHLRLRWK